MVRNMRYFPLAEMSLPLAKMSLPLAEEKSFIPHYSALLMHCGVKPHHTTPHKKYTSSKHVATLVQAGSTFSLCGALAPCGLKDTCRTAALQQT